MYKNFAKHGLDNTKDGNGDILEQIVGGHHAVALDHADDWLEGGRVREHLVDDHADGRAEVAQAADEHDNLSRLPYFELVDSLLHLLLLDLLIGRLGVLVLLGRVQLRDLHLRLRLANLCLEVTVEE